MDDHYKPRIMLPERAAPYSVGSMDSHPIRFVLNGRPVSAAGVDPHLSLLQYLREELRLTGTKEGCAEGDCGACTVVLGELQGNGHVGLKPINACIRPLPTLDGKAVFTVEGLKAANGSLHPVQQALADGYGSQCGFCTPGFVMSLLALYKNTPQPTRQQAVEALSGNLCRCTGYRPILDAAQAMLALDAPVDDAASLDAWLRAKAAPAQAPAAPKAPPHPGERALAVALDALRRSQDFSYVANGVTFHAPRSIASFSRLAQDHPEAWILAGGTDVGLWINKALLSARTILYTGAVPGLDSIEERAGWLEIGAAVTLEEAFCTLNQHYPEFAHVWLRFASVPIRSSGTLGGNVANGSPIGDSMPLLIALGSEVALRHGDAARTLPLEDLYLDYRKQARAPGEWVERVRVPLRRAGLELAAYKNAKRNEQDISAVCFAIALQRDGNAVRKVRIALGGMAGIPKRAPLAEASLTGKDWTEGTVRAAMAALADDFQPMSDMRATAAYRLRVAQNLLLRFFHETSGAAAGGASIELMETRVL